MTTKQRILDKVEESFKKAEKFYGVTMERPRNIIFKRNGTTAGHSNYGKKELMFQLDLAEHHEEEFINQTVPHEVAHYVDDIVYGNKYVNGRRQSHGPRWKYIMTRVYGLSPDRCHRYDTSVTKTKGQNRYKYACECGINHSISTTIHNRIRRGRTYRCNRCKTTIKLVGRNTTNTSPTVTLTAKEKEIQRLKEQIEQLNNKLNA